MKTLTDIDKSDWQRGPWDDEPDKAQWVDSETGLDCLAVRAARPGRKDGGSGHWCGYVGVPEGHPAHGKHYDAVSADVHGGLTFSATCSKDPRGVCHEPEPGRPDNIWWLGFDCAHLGDYIGMAIPDLLRGKMLTPFMSQAEGYKTLEFVKAECARLAKQLAAMVKE